MSKNSLSAKTLSFLNFLGYTFNETDQCHEIQLDNEGIVRFDINDSETLLFESRQDWLDEVWYRIERIYPNAVLSTSSSSKKIILNVNNPTEKETFIVSGGRIDEYDLSRYSDVLLLAVDYISSSNERVITSKICDLLTECVLAEKGSFTNTIIATLLSKDFDLTQTNALAEDLRRELESTRTNDITEQNVFKIMTSKALVSLVEPRKEFPNNEFIIHSINSNFEIELYNREEGEYIEFFDIKDIRLIPISDEVEIEVTLTNVIDIMNNSKLVKLKKPSDDAPSNEFVINGLTPTLEISLWAEKEDIVLYEIGLADILLKN